MQAFEASFEQRLEGLGRDSRDAAVFVYTQAALDYLASDFAVLDRLNQHPEFWIAVGRAFRSSGFIALGRVFDRRKGAHSAEALLDFAENHRGIFSRAALKARRMAAGMLESDAGEYVSDAYELPRGGLANLRAELKGRAEFFRETIGPIRHEFVAHTIGRDRRTAPDRFFVRPFEDLVVFTLRLHDALWRMYHDGREAPSNIGEVMKALPGEHVTSWEHLHAAKAVADIVEWLKRGPLEEK